MIRVVIAVLIVLISGSVAVAQIDYVKTFKGNIKAKLHPPVPKTGPAILAPDDFMNGTKAFGSDWSAKCYGDLVEMRLDGEIIYYSCFLPATKSRSFRTPIWTAHIMTPDKFASARHDIKPWSNFGSLSGNGKTFLQAQYDLGHLVPNGDMSGEPLHADATFNVINRAPQFAEFNRNGWRILETVFRNFAAHEKTSFLVFTGVSGSAGHTVDGAPGHEFDTQIPTHYWKLIYDKKSKSYMYFEGKNDALNITAAQYAAGGMDILGLWGPEYRSTHLPRDLRFLSLGSSSKADAMVSAFYDWLGATNQAELVSGILSRSKSSSPPLCIGENILSYSARVGRVRAGKGGKHTDSIKRVLLSLGSEKNEFRPFNHGCADACGARIQPRTVKKNDGSLTLQQGFRVIKGDVTTRVIVDRLKKSSNFQKYCESGNATIGNCRQVIRDFDMEVDQGEAGNPLKTHYEDSGGKHTTRLTLDCFHSR